MNTMYLANPLAVPGTGQRSRGYRYIRKPRNIAVRRSLLSVVDTLRGVSVPPNSWDDISRTIERNWKAHRKTQWREVRV